MKLICYKPSLLGEGNGTPLQYSCLENPMDGGAWQAAVHGVAKNRTRLSDFTFTFLHWRRKWQPTPVFLPGESQGRGSLVGCHLWGRAESDMTEVTQEHTPLNLFISLATAVSSESKMFIKLQRNPVWQSCFHNLLCSPYNKLLCFYFSGYYKPLFL